MAKSDNQMTTDERWRVWLTLVACFFECFFFAGSIFGWASMAYMLQQDGVYIQQCSNDTVDYNGKVNGTDDLEVKVNISIDSHHDLDKTALDSGCDAQRSSIALAFTFSTIFLGLMTFPNGMLFDKYGLRVTRCLATGLAVSGHLFLAFSAPHRLSFLIYPGSVLVGVSCSLFIMTSFHICLMAGPRSSTMSALNSGSVNSGAAIFLIIKLLYGYGFPRQYGLFCYAGLYTYSLAITFFLLPAKKVCPTFKEVDIDEKMGDDSKIENQINPLLEKIGDIEKKDSELFTKEKQQNSNKNALKQILLSPYFLLHLYWFAFIHLRVTFFSSAFNYWVVHLTGNDEEVSLLTNSYGYIQMGSVLICPAAGLLIDYFRRKIAEEQSTVDGVIRKDLARAVVPPLAIASLASVFLCICTLLKSRKAVWAACFLVELTRAFLYVTMGTFVSLTFPVNRFGILFGIVYATGGLTTALQYGLLQWSVAWSDFFYPNLVLMLAELLTFAHPANIYIRHLWARRSA